MFHHEASLLGLPDEAITEVLSYCGLEDVLNMSQTCKRLHKVCQRREVWTSLVQGLDIDCSGWISAEHSLECSSTSEIKDTLLRALQMRDAWRRPSRLRLSKETAIQFPNNRQGQVAVESQLVAGGSEILIVREGCYELWSLDTGELLWAAPPPEGNMFGTAANIDVSEDGRVLMIVCEFTSADEPIQNSIFRVYRYDRISRTAEVVSQVICPPIYMHDLEIKGDYFMMVELRSNERLLFNWKRGCGLKLEIRSEHVLNPPNLSVQYTNLSATHILGVFKRGDMYAFAMPLRAIDQQMTRSEFISEWASHSYDPTSGSFISLCHKKVAQDDCQCHDAWILNMHSFTPAWQSGATAELFILGYCLTGTNMKRLVSYRVQLHFPHEYDSSSSVQLSLVGAGCTLSPVLPWDKSCMFNSGHIVCLRERVSCFRLFTNMDGPLCIMELEDHPWHRDGGDAFSASVEPFSGKIVMVSNQRLVSYRFQSTADRDCGEETTSGSSVAA